MYNCYIQSALCVTVPSILTPGAKTDAQSKYLPVYGFSLFMKPNDYNNGRRNNEGSSPQDQSKPLQTPVTRTVSSFIN